MPTPESPCDTKRPNCSVRTAKKERKEKKKKKLVPLKKKKKKKNCEFLSLFFLPYPPHLNQVSIPSFSSSPHASITFRVHVAPMMLILILNSIFYLFFFLTIGSSIKKMENVEGKKVDLYIPRKW